MKKFYYKKEVSLEKSPIVRLERRHTLDTSKDLEEQSRISGRATSISSIDQLRELRYSPRARTREVTKSLSESVPRSSYSSASTVIVTETDLSSSWLYRSMKEAMQSKDENQNSSISPQEPSDSLAPVVLKDPKMKPIPVPIKRHNKISSRCCYLIIMLVITLCTLGILSTIGGIIYLEVFAKQTIDSHLPTESSSDFDLLHNAGSQHMDELANVNEDHGRMIDGIHVPSYTHEHENDSKNSELNENGETIHIFEFAKTPAVEMSRYIDKRTEIKSNFVLYGNSSNFTQSGNNTPVNIGKVANALDISPTVNNKNKENLTKELENVLNTSATLSENLKDFDVFPEISPELKESDDHIQDTGFKSEINGTGTGEDSKMSDEFNEDVPRISNLPEIDHLPMSVKSKIKDEALVSETNMFGIVNNPLMEEIVLKDKSPIKLTVYNVDENGGVDNTKLPESERIVEENGSVSTETEDDSSDLILKESPKAMVEISKIGDINPVGISNIQTTVIKPVKFTSQRPAIVGQDFNQRFKEKEQFQSFTTTKPKDIRETLVEAMKHLQALDANNMFPSSRAKSNKPALNSNSRQRTTVAPKKQDIAREQMLYLNNVRLILYDQLLRRNG